MTRKRGRIMDSGALTPRASCTYIYIRARRIPVILRSPCIISVFDVFTVAAQPAVGRFRRLRGAGPSDVRIA